MTEPTDAEILELASQYWYCLDETESATEIELVRAALAKWGTPQPVVREPLTDEQWQLIADLTDSILTRATKDEIERVIGITQKGGSNGL